MQSGLINKVAVTPSNVSNAKAVKHILPKQGAVFGDKGYCTKDSIFYMKVKNLHNFTIKTNNMKGKNFGKKHRQKVSLISKTIKRLKEVVGGLDILSSLPRSCRIHKNKINIKGKFAKMYLLSLDPATSRGGGDGGNHESSQASSKG